MTTIAFPEAVAVMPDHAARRLALLDEYLRYPDTVATFDLEIKAGRWMNSYVARLVANGRYMGLTMAHTTTGRFLGRTHHVSAQGRGRVLAEFVRSLPERMG